VLVVSLGKKPDDEYHQNLHMLSADIKGDSALLFTSRDEADVRKYLAKASGDNLTIKLQSFWQKDGTYKSFRKQKKAQSKKGESEDNEEEMED
jgi:hypothetical protein